MKGPGAVVILLLAAPAAVADSPFAAAALAPPDVSVYVHLSDVAQLRRDPALVPLSAWIESWLAEGELPGAWRELAEATGTAGSLLDACLGRQVTLLARRDDPSWDWALITDMSPRDSELLLRRLSARVLGPAHGVGLFALTDHGLLVGRRERLLVVGPADDGGLFEDVLGNLNGPATATLADGAAADAGRRLGPGRAGAYLRHRPPLGGWSVAVGDAVDGRLMIRHESQFERPPLMAAVTSTQWDPSPILRLRDAAMASMIEPTDAAGGPFESFLTSLLGSRLLPSALGDNLGPRRITVIRGSMPAIARLYEVRDAARAAAQLDRFIVGLAESLNRMVPEHVRVAVPDPSDFRTGTPRRIDAGPMARWLLGEAPGVDGLAVSWDVVDDGRTSWCVIASDPSHLTAVATDLEGSAPAGGAEQLLGAAGQWTCCGVARGASVAGSLAAWPDYVEALTGADTPVPLRHAASLLAGLSRCARECRWRLARPSDTTVVTEIEIELEAE